MGGFIGYGDIGVWTGNRERDMFLDWFAAHRCAKGDQRWEYFKSDALRWPGCCIELESLIPRGELLEVTSDELQQALADYGPDIARLLGVIAAITRGEWKFRVDMKEANEWRSDHPDRVGGGGSW
jgi:hypothetical protein